MNGARSPYGLEFGPWKIADTDGPGHDLADLTIHVNTYIQTDRQTDRQTYIQTYTHTFGFLPKIVVNISLIGFFGTGKNMISCKLSTEKNMVFLRWLRYKTATGALANHAQWMQAGSGNLR